MKMKAEKKKENRKTPHTISQFLKANLNWEREGRSPAGNLLSDRRQLLHVARHNLCLEVLQLVGLLGEGSLDA